MARPAAERGRTVEALRGLSHLTQTEAAREVGVSIQAVSGLKARHGLTFADGLSRTRCQVRAFERYHTLRLDFTDRPDLVEWLVSECPEDASIQDIVVAILEDARAEGDE